jgi:hypothetical protein
MARPELVDGGGRLRGALYDVERIVAGLGGGNLAEQHGIPVNHNCLRPNNFSRVFQSSSSTGLLRLLG